MSFAATDDPVTLTNSVTRLLPVQVELAGQCPRDRLHAELPSGLETVRIATPCRKGMGGVAKPILDIGGDTHDTQYAYRCHFCHWLAAPGRIFRPGHNPAGPATAIDHSTSARLPARPENGESYNA
jgi:hypothetical protein